ncbi:thiol-disulfide oxidoreductase DCC family protein [Lutibacter sp.]
MSMVDTAGKAVILFDGVCNLCTTSVHFIIRHDKSSYFLFASLQSDAAKEILLHFPSKKIKLDTIVLFEDGTIYDKSTAALRIAKKLNGGYKLLYFLIIIPRFIRDFGYLFIAKNRYKWFGKKKKCMIPSPEISAKFID